MNERRHKDTVERFEQDTARWLEAASGPMLVSAMQQTGFNKPDRFTYFVRYDPKLNPTMEALVEYDKPRAVAMLWFSLKDAQLSRVPFVFSNFYRLQALCEDDKKSCIATRVYEAFGTANSFKVTDEIKARFQLSTTPGRR